MTRFLIAFLLLAFGLSTEARAQCTAFVNASDGDDGNPGTQILPLRSIDFAYHALPSETVVCIAADEYFLADDGDGIAFDVPGKSMTFEIQKFAGNSVLRFSEKAFIVDSGTGTITFRAGSANQLVFGLGVVNFNDPARPDLLNFLHTIVFRSGTVDFSGVSVTIESTLGGPRVINPTNTQKTAPPDARIEFGDIQVTGPITYANASRTIVFSSSLPTRVLPPLPPNGDGDMIVFRQDGALVFPDALNFTTGGLRFFHAGSVLFTNPVRFSDPESSVVIDGSSSGSIAFDGGLELVGLGGTGVLLDHNGTGQTSISSLALDLSSPAIQADMTIRSRGGGVLRLDDVVYTGTSNSDIWEFSLDVENSVLVLGNPLSGTTVNAGFSISGQTSLNGDVTTGSDGRESSFVNTGIVDLSEFQLTALGSGLFSNSGQISGSSTAGLVVDGTRRLLNDGDITGIKLVGGGVILEGAGRVLGDMEVASSGSATLVSGSTLTVTGALVLTSGALSVSPTVQIFLKGDVLFQGGAFSNTQGTLVMTGSDQAVLGGNTARMLPALRIDGNGLVIGGSMQTSSFDLVSGSVSVQPNSWINVSSNLSIENGTFTSGSGALFTVDGSMIQQGGKVVFGDSNLLRCSGDVLFEAGSMDAAGLSLVLFGSSTHVVGIVDSLALQGLSWEDQGNTTEISGTLEITDNLVPGANTVSIQSGSTLRLNGDIRLTQPGTVFAPDSNLEFTGSSQTASGFIDVVLPVVFSSADILDFQDAALEFNLLTVQSGSVLFSAASTVRVNNALTVLRGSLLIPGGSVIRLDGNVTIASGSLIAATGAVLHFRRDVTIGQAAIEAASATFDFSGQTVQNVTTRSFFSVGTFRLSGAGTRVVFPDSSGVSVNGMLRTESNTFLDLGRAQIRFVGKEGVSGAVVDGDVLATTGSLSFTGPAIGSTNYQFSGSGFVERLQIALSDPASSVVIGSSSTLEFGSTTVSGGVLDLNGSDFVFSAAVSNPVLRVGLGNTSSFLDGGLTDSTRPVVFNPGARVYDLEYFGSISNIYTLGLEFQSNRVRNFFVSAVDAVNSPPAFGLVVSGDHSISGSLQTIERSLLRLQNGNLTLEGADQTHLIEGAINGEGKLIVTNSADLSSSSANGAAKIASLQFEMNPEDTSHISGIRQINNLDVRSGHVELSLGHPETDEPGIINSMFSVTGGSVAVLAPLNLGASGQPGTLTVSSADLVLSTQSRILVREGGSVSVDVSSSVGLRGDLLVTDPGGFIIFDGAGLLRAEAFIPRLRLDARVGTVASDDVFLTGNAGVSDIFDMNGGDLFLGTSTFTHAGTEWYFDTDQTPFDGNGDDIFGDFSSDQGNVVLAGPVTFHLGSNLGIFSSNLRLAAAPSDTIRIESSSNNPWAIVLFGKRFFMESGVLNLGLNDLKLEGSSAGMLTYSGGAIVASSNPQVPSRLQRGLSSPAMYPFDDSDFGEIVFGGGGSASIILSSRLEIPSLTLEGTTRLEAGNAPLLVSNRLVFGETGSSLLSGQSQDLELANGARIIRRGQGSLSQTPVFQGRIDVFYELDDGDVTGNSVGFGPGILSSGAELPRDPQSVGVLGVFSGGANMTPNTLRLTNDVHIDSTLILLGGILDQSSQRITFSEGAHLEFVELDPRVAPELSADPGVSYSTEGPIDVRIANFLTDFRVSSTNLPSLASIRTLTIESGTTGLARPVSVLLQTDVHAGQFVVDNARPEDSFVLGGHDILTAGDVLVKQGLVTSGPAAQFDIGGKLIVLDEGEIRGGISADIAGKVTLQGAFNGLLLQLQGDVFFGEAIGTGPNLIFTGFHQTLQFTAPRLLLNGMTLTQSASEGTAEHPGVHLINEVTPTAELEFISPLSLANGLMVTNDVTVVLNGSSQGFIRSVQPGGESHIVGSISKDLEIGESQDIVFPVGDSTSYRPFTIGFPEPLLSSSRFTVGHEGVNPVGENGFPIQTSTGFLNESTPYSWVVRSTVNFSQSQMYRISLDAPDLPPSSVDSLRIINRSPSSFESPWTLTAESSDNSVLVPNGVRVVADGITGGLAPEGIRFGIGLPSGSDAARAALQFVYTGSGAQSGAQISTDVYFDGTQILGSVSPFSASSAVSIALPTMGPGDHLVELRAEGSPPNTDPVVASTVTLAPERLTMLMLSSTDGAPDLFSEASLPIGRLPEETALLFFNASEAGPSFDIVRTDPQPRIAFPTLVPHAFSPFFSFPASLQVFDVLDQSTSELQDQFALDLSAFGGSSLTAFLTFDSSTGQTALYTVLPDGTLLPAAVVTGVDIPPSAGENVPAGFALHGNYPNPFNPATTLVFDLPESAVVTVVVVDMLGRIVTEIDAGALPAGKARTLRLDASNWASGTYAYRVIAKLQSTVRSATGMLVVVK